MKHKVKKSITLTFRAWNGHQNQAQQQQKEHTGYGNDDAVPHHDENISRYSPSYSEFRSREAYYNHFLE